MSFDEPGLTLEPEAGTMGPEMNMPAKERRRNLYRVISKAREADPQVFSRRARTAEAIAQQAYRSSRIEGCDVRLEDLRVAANELAGADS
jgi:hypothetical protein